MQLQKVVPTRVCSVQTVCIALWMASHCAKILRPLKTSLQRKKKKKKKEGNAAAVGCRSLPWCDIDRLSPSMLTLCLCLQPVAVCGFQELAGNLQDVINQALEHIKGQETGITALKLATLSLEGCPQVSKDFVNLILLSNYHCRFFLRFHLNLRNRLPKRIEAIGFLF